MVGFLKRLIRSERMILDRTAAKVPIKRYRVTLA